MRLIWINQHAAPVGGAERYVHETAAGLAQRGHASYLLYDVAGRLDAGFLAPFAGAFPLVDAPRQLAALRGDAVYVQRYPSARILPQLLAAGPPVLRFWHDHEPLCLRQAKYTLIGRRTCTRPLGAHCYVPCLGFLARRRGRFPPLGLQFLGPLRRDLRDSRACAAQVVASEYLAEHLAEHGLPRERIHVAPLFAGEPVAKEPGTAVPVPRARDLILFVGQLLNGKGIDTLLHALRALPAARLICVGGGDANPWSTLAGQLGLAARVTFRGRLAGAELARAYAEASVLALPSRSPETFGLVGVEAMSHGLPVVASAVGGIGMWLEHEVTGLAVPPNDPAALAAALGRVLGDSALGDRLGAAGHRAWQQRFRRDHHLDRLQAILAGCVPALEQTQLRKAAR